MCDPITLGIATAVSGATQAIGGFIGATQEAKAQNQRYRINKENSLDAYADDIEAQNLNLFAEQEASSQRQQEAQRDGVYARSLARVSSGERGVGGLTAAALEADLGFQEGRQIASINRNDQLNNSRFRTAGRALTNQTQSRINSVRRGVRPSPFALIAGLSGSALQGFAAFDSASTNRLQRQSIGGP